jgi:hypothetical protein
VIQPITCEAASKSVLCVYIQVYKMTHEISVGKPQGQSQFRRLVIRVDGREILKLILNKLITYLCNDLKKFSIDFNDGAFVNPATAFRVA